MSKAATDNIITHGNARFTVITPELIRMEYSKTGAFIDAPSLFAVNRDAAFSGFALGAARNPLVIDTGKIRLTHNDDGNPFSAENLSAEIHAGGVVATWHPGMDNPGNLGGTIRTVDGVAGPVDLGEGVLSRAGWTLYDDSAMQLFTKDWVEARPSDAGTDWYLFGYGHDYVSALQALAAISGPAPLPRKYTLGAWYSRYWPYSSDDYRQIAAEYHNHDFPLDVMVMDMDWHKDGWTGWSWNRKLLPDAEDLLKWFHEKDLAVTLNVHPADGVGPHEDMYADFMKAMGKDPASKETLPYDAGSKKYLDTLFKFTHEDKEAAGVDFWWLDWQQYPYTRSVPGLTNLRWLNHYYYTHTAHNGLRGQSFSRYAGWGDHRYPVHFSGDASTGWPMLAFEVPLTSTAGNIGIFYWSHDIGGHMGLRIPESYTRWVQFGATTAALRSHSTRNPELDRRPWKYPSWAENSMRIAFHLRSELFPYIYSTAHQANAAMMPMNRPMYILHPDDDKAYANPQQYYFGDALLAAPIVAEGQGPGRVGTQVVWFPEGSWYNWFTGERFAAGDEALVTADIDEFPLYARGGIPIPMQPYRERMGTAPLDDLVVRCYPGEDGSTGEFLLYEDDGVTDQYKTGAFATTRLSCTTRGDQRTITIDPADGVFQGQVEERAYTIEFPCTGQLTDVNLAMDSGNQESSGIDLTVPLEYDAARFMNRIILPATSIRKRITLTVTAAAADRELLKRNATARRVRALLGEKAADPLNVKNSVTAYSGEYPQGPFNTALLAAGGTGLFMKNEALYLYQGVPRAFFYAAPGLMDGDAFTMKIKELYGATEKVLAEEKHSVTHPQRFDARDIPLPPAPPEFGVRMQHIMQAEFTINGKPFTLADVISTHASFLTKWNVAGPFPYDRGDITKTQYGPERDGVDLAAVYKGAHAAGVNWRKAKPAEDGTIDLNEHFYISQDSSLAYAVTYLYSKEDQDVTFRVNSDDSSELWVNGEKLLSKSVARGFDLDRDLVPAHLKKGVNEILIKVSQYNFDWKFRVSVEGDFAMKQAFRARE